MDATLRRTLTVLALCAVAAVAGDRVLEPSRAGAPAPGGVVEITPEVRAAGLRFGPEVSESDRTWVLAAVAAARPEAQRLIDEVDGLVTVETQPDLGQAIGLAKLRSDSATIVFATAALNGDRALDRNVAVLHELGHVVDHMLVPDEVVEQLDAGIPRLGSCQSPSDAVGPCTAIEERFADTFAKWALGGRVSLAGSGYGIPAPASIEDWGAPLGLLAAQLNLQQR